MIGWTFVSRIGAVNVMLPLAIAVALALGARGHWRQGWSWCALVGGVMVVTAASKIAFFGWGVGIRALDFTGFSGHAALAAAIVPATFVFAVQNRSGPLRLTGFVFGLLVAALVAIARVKLHAHSVSEAVGGALIGSVVSVVFARTVGPALVLCRPLVVGCLLAMVMASLMKPLPTQRWMMASALYLSGHDRPYTRQGWKRAARPRALAPPANGIIGSYGG